MKTLRALAALLSYPTAELVGAASLFAIKLSVVLSVGITL